MLSKLKNFLSFDLWNFPLRKLKGFSYCYYKFLRIFFLAIASFFSDRCALRASALTFYSMMAVVPVLAMSFAIAKGFGYQAHLEKELTAHFQDQTEVINEVITFAQNLLEKTRGGLIAGIGVILLVFSAVKVMYHIESALNKIWGVVKPRSWHRKCSDYFAIALIGPVLFIIASSVTVFIVSKLQAFIENLPLYTTVTSFFLLLLKLAPYCLIWILFSFIYLVMPNTRVRAVPAFIAGIIAGSFYQFVQWIYIFFQIGVTRYGAIYGSFAAVPLFLLWLQFSWIIVLIGAEVSYAIQNAEKHEFEMSCTNISHNYEILISLWITHQCLRRFSEREPAITRNEIHQILEIPSRLVERIIKTLIDTGILQEIKGKKKYDDAGLQPGIPIHDLKIKDVIDLIESHGTNKIPHMESSVVKQLEGSLQVFRDLLEQSAENKYLKDIKELPHE